MRACAAKHGSEVVRWMKLNHAFSPNPDAGLHYGQWNLVKVNAGRSMMLSWAVVEGVRRALPWRGGG